LNYETFRIFFLVFNKIFIWKEIPGEIGRLKFNIFSHAIFIIFHDRAINN